ncbi:MAG: hypothetical protein M0Z61_12690 [Nitrospiraceae bacterium]|nr:hypothetical protein [Nitrospiraceae bacterium]
MIGREYYANVSEILISGFCLAAAMPDAGKAFSEEFGMVPAIYKERSIKPLQLTVGLILDHAFKKVLYRGLLESDRDLEGIFQAQAGIFQDIPFGLPGGIQAVLSQLHGRGQCGGAFKTAGNDELPGVALLFRRHVFPEILLIRKHGCEAFIDLAYRILNSYADLQQFDPGIQHIKSIEKGSGYCQKQREIFLIEFASMQHENGFSFHPERIPLGISIG